ncbi:protein HEXIM1-like [Haliotis rubra]|uniref:protein HEXIM1-like n=1 Tax=Haliotis rubra TaxID=36100 RepID=UPI001EE5EB3D|nr:protein HEXIM1-like [Haliotis rubra]
MQIIEEMADTEEVKMKKTRRGKRCGRRTRRGEKSWDEMAQPSFSSDMDTKSVKGRKFYVRPRYSPKAPHNSTQFIMDDQHHCLVNSEHIFDFSRCDEMSIYCNDEDASKGSAQGSPSSECDCTSPHSCSWENELNNLQLNSSQYMANDFESFYNQLRAEELSKLSKDELVEEILSMEEKVSGFEERMQKMQRNTNTLSPAKHGPTSPGLCNPELPRYVNVKARSTNHMSSLLKELELLKQENRNLKQKQDSLLS